MADRVPKTFRVMDAEGDQPALGSRGYTLGVRVPPDPNADVMPDDSGSVSPTGMGMSVAPSKADLRSYQVPRRLRSALNRPDARGRDDRRVWRHGEGTFTRAPIAADIELVPDPGASPTHGVVQPSRTMPLDSYFAALEGTRPRWEIDE